MQRPCPEGFCRTGMGEKPHEVIRCGNDEKSPRLFTMRIRGDAHGEYVPIRLVPGVATCFALGNCCGPDGAGFCVVAAAAGALRPCPISPAGDCLDFIVGMTLHLVAILSCDVTLHLVAILSCSLTRP